MAADILAGVGMPAGVDPSGLLGPLPRMFVCPRPPAPRSPLFAGLENYQLLPKPCPPTGETGLQHDGERFPTDASPTTYGYQDHRTRATRVRRGDSPGGHCCTCGVGPPRSWRGLPGKGTSQNPASQTTSTQRTDAELSQLYLDTDLPPSVPVDDTDHTPSQHHLKLLDDKTSRKRQMRKREAKPSFAACCTLHIKIGRRLRLLSPDRPPTEDASRSALSTSSVERIFSLMKLIKTRLRSRLLETTFRKLIFICLNSDGVLSDEYATMIAIRTPFLCSNEASTVGFLCGNEPAPWDSCAAMSQHRIEAKKELEAEDAEAPQEEANPEAEGQTEKTEEEEDDADDPDAENNPGNENNSDDDNNADGGNSDPTMIYEQGAPSISLHIKYNLDVTSWCFLDDKIGEVSNTIGVGLHNVCIFLELDSTQELVLIAA
eukprot:gene19863-1011_t